MNAVTARIAAPLPVWSGRSKQRNWLLVGLLCLARAPRTALLFFLSHRLSTDGAARDGKTPAADLQSEKRRGRRPSRSTRQRRPTRPRRPSPIPTRPTCNCRTTRSHSTNSCRKCTATAALPDDTRDVLPDKPQGRADESEFGDQRNREDDGAVARQRRPTRKREQALLNDVADSGRPQPAMTGTELATSTTIKRPNTFQRQSGRQRRAADRSRARFQRFGIASLAKGSPRRGHEIQDA